MRSLATRAADACPLSLGDRSPESSTSLRPFQGRTRSSTQTLGRPSLCPDLGQERFKYFGFVRRLNHLGIN